jgi:HEAT repeat protein
MAALAEDIRHLSPPLQERAIAPLLAALDAADFRARAVAMKVLGRRAPVDLLLASLGDSEYILRDVAACALGAMGADAPIDALLHKLEDPAPLVRNADLPRDG